MPASLSQFYQGSSKTLRRWSVPRDWQSHRALPRICGMARTEACRSSKPRAGANLPAGIVAEQGLVAGENSTGLIKLTALKRPGVPIGSTEAQFQYAKTNTPSTLM